MRLSRRLINILGVLLVAVVLIAGGLLGAMPVLLEASSTDQEADEVVSANELHELQVVRLRAEQERFDEIEASLSALRAQIPADDQLDDVFAIVNSAARSTDATIESATAGEPAAWVERAAPAPDEDAAATVPPAAGAPVSEETAPATETSPAEGNAGTAPASPEAAPAPPETEVPFTIVVRLPDTAAAARFIDALGAGPRLLSITHVAMTETAGEFTLTVDALTFVRTEN